MTKWKWWLAFESPPGFVVNENGDYFWLDRRHMGVIRRFCAAPLRLAGAGAVRTLARLVSFPFTFLYLLLYAMPFMFEGLCVEGEACLAPSRSRCRGRACPARPIQEVDYEVHFK